MSAECCRNCVPPSVQRCKSQSDSNEVNHLYRVSNLKREISLSILSLLLTSTLAVAQTSTSSSSKLEPTPQYSVSAAELRVPAKAWRHLRAAHEQFVKMNLPEAAKEIGYALREDPPCAEAFSMRAFIKLAAHDLSGAVEDAERAVAIDPHDAESYLALGTAYNSLKEFQKATEAAGRALSISPNAWLGRLEMAKSLYGQNQFVLALQELDLTNKDFPDVHLVRGNVLMRLARRPEAVKEFEIFLSEAPKDPRAEQIKQIVENGQQSAFARICTQR
jgi:tetratricopeptide (TPR) repeat protein